MKSANETRRVVVTGMGAVTPIGLDVESFWAAMKRGQCGVSPLVGFPLDDLKILIAAQIKDFDPRARLRGAKRDKIIILADRYSWFAAAAADEAVKQARLQVPLAEPYRAACIIGSGAGGLVTYETAYRDLFIHNKRATHPLTLLRIIGSSASAHVGIEYGVKGPTFATCSACSTATHAIGIARDYIRNGLVDVAIAGASESVINYGTMKAWQALHVLSPDGCFPFSRKRNGTVLG
ncbi:MAG TPA: beta-ketoacyl synthase N-terminal-like domain-containing protein, partial [Hyphomicrobiaceae bacterium]|nr:beta-ketoacyl synthase N-terminal-like domain-containing protein [Hyphomicrobiaceae bacterium]